ncbi:50S ribosomal protein L11 methyltransferase [Spiribacter pallidus]|uniref:50S ribosomal protein L11 methyltransferase n=1 Tax=Spiribacter pallidus TaxID=1987936 RepID=UPI00349F700A
MSDWQLSFPLPAADAERAEAVLEAHGATAISLCEAAGATAVLEPAPGETRLWDAMRAEVLFGADVDQAAVADAVARALDLPPTELKWAPIEARDWERVWLDDFKPLDFGHGLWVVPHGMTPPASATIPVRLDPGLAFGTGTHPTTALCLEALAAAPPVGQTLIDYGCGSGILAVAALKLGARRVIAIDNDPQALTATRDNARANQVAGAIETGLPGHDLPVADAVVANILAGILKQLAPVLTDALTPGGRLLMSGVLADQAAAVRRAYTPAIDFVDDTRRDGWICLRGHRRLS